MLDDRRVHRVEREAGVAQPGRQFADSRLAVIVEVPEGGEQLDLREPKLGHFGEMFPAQRLLVVEVCRNPEAHAAQSYRMGDRPAAACPRTSVPNSDGTRAVPVLRSIVPLYRRYASSKVMSRLVTFSRSQCAAHSPR